MKFARVYNGNEFMLLWRNNSDAQTGKNTPIRRTAVRETDVFWHHGGPVEEPMETFEHRSNIVSRGEGRLSMGLPH